METDYLVFGSIIGCCFLLGLLTALLSYQKLVNKRQLGELEALKLQLAAKTEKLNTLLKEREREQEDKADFIETLTKASVTTRLQQPRLQIQGHKVPDPPDKYRYLANMVKNGMSAEDIAAILDISPAEADQLVTLAQMSWGKKTEEKNQSPEPVEKIA